MIGNVALQKCLVHVLEKFTVELIDEDLIMIDSGTLWSQTIARINTPARDNMVEMAERNEVNIFAKRLTKLGIEEWYH